MWLKNNHYHFYKSVNKNGQCHASYETPVSLVKMIDKINSMIVKLQELNKRTQFLSSDDQDGEDLKGLKLEKIGQHFRVSCLQYISKTPKAQFFLIG